MHWRNSMKDEIYSLVKNNTWEICTLREGRKTVGTRWIYRIKRDVNGEIFRFKSRLCALGYRQERGIDFDKTFAPTGRKTSLRCFFAIASAKKLNS